MANKYQVVDEILKVQGEGTYNVTFTNLNITDTENTESVEVVGAITEAVKSNLGLTYSDITDAPGLPVDTNNESPAYETVSGDRKIKDFQEVAFTGSYDSLADAPGIPAEGYDNGEVKDFDPIAFTGITDLGNVQVSAMLDLRSYSGGVDTLGQDSTYVDTLPAGLANALGGFYDNFSQNKGKKPFFVITNAVTGGKVFSVLQVNKVGPGGADGYYYYKIDVANVNTSDYPYVNGTKGSSVLDDIEISSQLGCFIFDLVNNCIYYKSENIGNGSGVTSYNDLTDKPTLFSGDYDDLSNKPVLNASANNSDITGLANVAISGSFDDLEDGTYVFAPGQFIHRYDSTNDNWTLLTGDELTVMGKCGYVAQNVTVLSAWVKNIHQLYASEDNTNDNFVDKVNELINEFNTGKLCYLAASKKKKLITDIITNYVNDTLVHVSIYCALENTNNFNAVLINNSVTTDNEIDIVSNSLRQEIWQPSIIIDLNHKILYSNITRVYPVYRSNYGISVTDNNGIGTIISNKSGNMLSIISTNGEEGLYVAPINN